MATLINNAGVQHYANKMVLAENRKVGSKSLPTALADIDNLIDEMKTHFDTEYGSALDMKLENNENVFSVGTGTNVDKRSEVENSFTDVELSGNSLVNLAIPSSSSKRFYKSDRRYTLGKSTINLFKSNTTYTVFFEVSNLVLDGVVGIDIHAEHVRFNNHGSQLCKVTSNGFYKGTFSTGTLDNTSLASFVLKGTPTQWDNIQSETMEITLSKVVVLEGDWTNKPIPQYFEGLKSVGEKEDGNHKISISSTKNGLNLIKNSKNARLSPNNTGLGESVLKNDEKDLYYRATPNSDKNVSLYWIIEPNKSQLLKTNKIVIYSIMVRPEQDCFITFYGNKHSSTMTHSVKGGVWTRVYTKPFEYLVSTGESFILSVDGNMKSKYLDYKELKIEYGEKATDWCPSFEEIKQYPKYLDEKEILLNEPLRGLPNGIRDTIEKVNGEWKIVRRCHETILDGSEDWRSGGYTNTDRQELYLSPDKLIPSTNKRGVSGMSYNNYISNNFPTIQGNIATSNRWLAINGIGGLTLALPKDELAEPYFASAKQWLSQNPTKVVYELETPIIEDISPITLQCWKNGTIFIDEVLPVETTHTVALNKPAQIRRNIEELTALRKRVQALEDFYDQVALEQSHQLSLLNNSIELDYDI